ncbi:MAG: hypothetical protein J6T10_26965 [Methanobrevibacter sp.]|nr:hypothetical protein [Methanobrevibacter sp.]
MGQRLNIEIHENGKCLANAYYHWSAYTDSALALTETIINYYPRRINLDGLSAAIELLRRTGADFTYNELINAGMSQELAHALTTDSNRNDGLIFFTEKEMEITRNWEEGRVTINIDTQTIDFDCWCKWGVEEAHYEKHIPFNTHCILFDDFYAFCEWLTDIEDTCFCFCDGNKYTAIY